VTTEFNFSGTIALGAITFSEIEIAVKGTINTVIIIAVSSERVTATNAFFGFSGQHGLVLIFLVKVIDGQGH
jgi:hypothetical protein